MTVIRPNSITGVSSITTNGGDLSLFRSDGTTSDIIVNNVTSGIITATKFVGNGADLTGIDAGTLKHNNNTKAQATASGVTITGDLGVSGVLTYEDVTNVDSVGVITARDGLRVTGIATVSALEITDGTTSVNKHSVGIGTTTTAGRNAGVSTAPGTMIYNATSGKVQIYVSNQWKNIKLEPTALTLSYLVIGGGGAGGGHFRGGGGGAGAYRTNWNNESQGGGQSSGSALTGIVGTAYSIVVGAGGGGNSGSAGSSGSQSKFDNITADGGTGGGRYEQAAPSNSGNGSGGGGGGANSGATSGGAGGTYGYAGGTGSASDPPQTGGGGGGAASAGKAGDDSTPGLRGDGGLALASTITGSSVLRAGGGGAGSYGGGNNYPEGGGGGAGSGRYAAYLPGFAATANTGSGGGGATGDQNAAGGAGGSGVVILRYPSEYTATYTGGVTKTSSTVDGDIVDIITATSNSSQTVTFAGP